MDVITLSAKTCMAHLLLKETFDQFSFIGPGKLCRFPGEAPDWRLPGRGHPGLVPELPLRWDNAAMHHRHLHAHLYHG